MAFHFTLEPVLRYRRSLEERERLRLQGLLARRAVAMREIERLCEARSDLRNSLQRCLEEAHVSAAEVQLCHERSSSMERIVARVRTQLEALQTEIVRQTERYDAERQRSEVLQSLRELQLRVYRQTQQRREQAMLDELHLLRRSRS